MSLEDSIRKELNFDDSIKVLATQYYEGSSYSYEFIDYNKNSKFHEVLKKYRFTRYDASKMDKLDSNSHKEYFKEKGSGKITKPLIPKNLVAKWIPIYKYKSEFYLYMDCDWQSFFEINDSAFVGHNMESEWLIPIKSYNNTSQSEILTLFDADPINFKLIDPAKSIYAIKQTNYPECEYFTKLENLNKFLIIYQYCQDETDNLIEFDKVTCE